jgi:ATP-dependent protease ClpP protease subunit
MKPSPPTQFVQELNALQVDKITVRINSMGGSVPDGLAIYNAMRRHAAHITVEVDGMAFSIASLIAMGGDTVHMAANALMMIHAPWTVAAGNAAELRQTADTLDTWAAAMASSYAAKTGKTSPKCSRCCRTAQTTTTPPSRRWPRS